MLPRIPALLLLAASLTGCTDPTVNSPAIAKAFPQPAQSPGDIPSAPRNSPSPSAASLPMPARPGAPVADDLDPVVQRQLALAYLEGKTARRDPAKAFELFKSAAGQGDAEAQYQLARMYHLGLGVEHDDLLASAWAAIAANKGMKAAASLIGKPQEASVRAPSGPVAPPSPSGPIESVPALPRQALAAPAIPVTVEAKISGAALLVSSDGRAVTSRQLVQDCRELLIPGQDGPVRVVAEDAIRDLALLEIAGQFSAGAPISPAPDRELDGEEVAVLVLASPGTAASGSGDGRVTSLAARTTQGQGNNRNQIELSVALESGAGGSPVLDRKGDVVGLVSPSPGKGKMADPNPRSVNFAVGGEALRTFLDSHRVAYRRGGESSLFSDSKPLAEISQAARQWTLALECRK